MIGIYKITNPKGRVYIGQSTNIEKRWNYYFKLLLYSSQPKLERSLKKYGSGKHKFEIIEQCSVELLNERERYWQDHFNVLKEGLNCMLQPVKAKRGVFSTASKNKMSKSKKGHSMYNKEWREKISLGNKGRIQSKEERDRRKVPKPKGFGQKISKILKGKINNGKIFSKEIRNKMSNSHKGKKFTKEHCLNIGKAKLGNQYLKGFKYSQESKDKISLSKSIPILCIETNSIFKNIDHASKEMNITQNIIRNICKGRREKAKGYSFKYANK